MKFDVVIKNDEDGYYVATVPDLAGCHTQAMSLDELISRIKEAILLCLDVKKRYSFRPDLAAFLSLAGAPSFLARHSSAPPGNGPEELFVQAGLVFQDGDIQVLILSWRKRNLPIQGLSGLSFCRSSSSCQLGCISCIQRQNKSMLTEAVGKVFNYYQFYVMLQKIGFALEIYVMQRSIYIPLMIILLKNSKLEVLICFRTGFNANHVLCSDQISILN